MNSQLDYRAIATFCAIGFFLDDDTYYLEDKFRFNASASGKWLGDFQKFNWYYDPKPISLEDATKQFSELLDRVVDKQVGERNVILPLSGGLDSRTLASSLHKLGKKVTGFSYQFPNGVEETKYAKQIAKVCGFPIETRTVPEGYLWNKIDELALLNHCYTDFTHPRQMAFANEVGKQGEVICLGHWGDVLFDGSGVPDDISFEKQVDKVLQKIIKKGGADLAEDLWKTWELEGRWIDYFRERVSRLLKSIPIENSANARIRAFKSRYWATRWTAANFTIFEKSNPVIAPFYDTRFCDFICKIPESILNSRQIQIQYLLKYAPDLARITWQAKRPYNLFNYHNNTTPWNLPFRVYDKFYRSLKGMVGQKWIQRNWEIQFQGKSNESNLYSHLQELVKHDLIPGSIIQKYYNLFLQSDPVKYAHPVSMLLTVSLFSKYKKA